ncbi:MAG: peptidase P60 [Rhizobium sp.]|nr:peptidase P60 [Rhizobium sp.]
MSHAIVDIARSWTGTPYHNLASVRGAGCDCVGLLRGIWREAYGTEAPALPVYSANWRARGGNEGLLDAAARHLDPRSIDERGPGLVLIFRIRPGLAARHCGVMTDARRMVHAHSGRAVHEVDLGDFWNGRVSGVFAFRGF